MSNLNTPHFQAFALERFHRKSTDHRSLKGLLKHLHKVNTSKRYAPYTPIIQSSGSGKTTLLRDVAELIPSVICILGSESNEQPCHTPPGGSSVTEFFAPQILTTRAFDLYDSHRDHKDLWRFKFQRPDLFGTRDREKILKSDWEELMTLTANMWEHASVTAYMSAIITHCTELVRNAHHHESVQEVIDKHYGLHVRSKHTFDTALQEARKIRDTLMLHPAYALSLRAEDPERWITSFEDKFCSYLRVYLLEPLAAFEKRISGSRTYGASPALKRDLKECSFPVLIIAFDELARLSYAEKDVYGCGFDLNTTPRFGNPSSTRVEVLAASTSVVIRGSPPEEVHENGPPGHRYTPLPLKIWPRSRPFRGLGSDVNWDLKSDPPCPQDWADEKRMCLFGRGLWQLYRDSDVSVETSNKQILSKMLDINTSTYKIPNSEVVEGYRNTFAVEAYEKSFGVMACSETFRVYALISAIVNLQFGGRSFRSVEHKDAVVSKHLHILSEADDDMATTYQWSEPILAWAATNLLYGQWTPAIKFLNDLWVQTGSVDIGTKGALVARLLISHAFAGSQIDWTAQWKEPHSLAEVLPRKNSYTLGLFLLVLLGSVGTKVAEKMGFLRSATMNANHFTSLTIPDRSESISSAKLLKYCFRRCCAMIMFEEIACPILIIPIYLGDPRAPFLSSKLSAIFIKVSNVKQFDTPAAVLEQGPQASYKSLLCSQCADEDYSELEATETLAMERATWDGVDVEVPAADVKYDQSNTTPQAIHTEADSNMDAETEEQQRKYFYLGDALQGRKIAIEPENEMLIMNLNFRYNAQYEAPLQLWEALPDREGEKEAESRMGATFVLQLAGMKPYEGGLSLFKENGMIDVLRSISLDDSNLRSEEDMARCKGLGLGEWSLTDDEDEN